MFKRFSIQLESARTTEAGQPKAFKHHKRNALGNGWNLELAPYVKKV